ncbi:uncharacterized protein [Drosophila virilis]|uniref:Uncharacterized protein n=1 Tax=Drosophila virilis TaxID=7244 RepID=B4LE84_DROVI|nr:uncharacterized protein LOC6623026 [Drosophila virilis]EDW69040.1 uncharacterized protein Dvir_GJ13021 [Drosophila virilis]
MNSLGQLKRCLQRRYRTVASAIVFVALLTFFLEQSYVGQQRDLLYWREMVLHISHQPCLLCCLTATVLCPLLIMLLIQQRLIQSIEYTVAKLMRLYRRRKFADFIVRRLLLQLELAMQRMPGQLEAQQLLDDPITRRRYQLASEAAHRAVDIFRRDAAALLFQGYRLYPEDTTYVLREEELVLLHGGYGQIELHVNSQVLRRLLYPQGKSLA